MKVKTIPIIFILKKSICSLQIHLIKVALKHTINLKKLIPLYTVFFVLLVGT